MKGALEAAIAAGAGLQQQSNTNVWICREDDAARKGCWQKVLAGW
jgi:hypothetical protein